MSCISNPDMEIKYINGVVTHFVDTDKCIIDHKYQYQPRTEIDINNFLYIKQGSEVRVSLCKKKNSNSDWIVFSCFLRDRLYHQETRDNNVSKTNFYEPIDPITMRVPQLKKNHVEDNCSMICKVLGDMPKSVDFEKEITIQIIFKNQSYIEEKKLLNYKTMEGNDTQMSIVNKIELPVKIRPQTEHVFDINIIGKFIGMSTEKVIFIFTDINYLVDVNINVTDPRTVSLSEIVHNKNTEIDVPRLLELENNSMIPDVHCAPKQQFRTVRIKNWTIPEQLTKCFRTENGKYNFSKKEVEEKIGKFYPVVFENLTYQNYKAKFHTLLFIEEIEVKIGVEKYNREKIHFEHMNEYLVLKIPDLSQSRPSLKSGDRVMVTDPPHCVKRLGNYPGQYEGTIHKVLANEIWLKFDSEFHTTCEHRDYSVSFFLSRALLRKKHEVVEQVSKNNRLGELFLFPLKENIEYQTPKLAITNIGDVIDSKYNCLSNNIQVPIKVIDKIRWINKNLNAQQKNAIINILKGEARPLPYVILGPPGTGKTKTLTESIIQVYKELPDSKLLICAPTNSAVDCLLGNLVCTGLFDKTKLKRLIGYNYFINNTLNPDLVDYYAFLKLDNVFNGSEKSELGKLLIRKKDILKLRLVVITEGSAGMLYSMGLKSGTFTHIFVDEAGQTSEPEILIPLSFLDPLRGGQVVLAGDPKQLGPSVFSLIAQSNGLAQSMLARFIQYPSYKRDTLLFPKHNGYNPKVITHLVKNYRSLPEIVHTFGKLFYDSLLESTKLSDNVFEKVFLISLNNNVHWDIKCKGPIVVHGIIGNDSQEPSSPSWFNPQEAFQVLLYVTKLMNSGIPVEEIGIISPYLAQVAKINELLCMHHSETNLPKVGSVEMFQGQEKMVIIISMVRGRSKTGSEEDKKFNLGFLVAKQRTNVALSRGKSLMIIIGNPSTMLCSPEWKYVLTEAIKNNNYVGCNVPDIA